MPKFLFNLSDDLFGRLRSTSERLDVPMSALVRNFVIAGLNSGVPVEGSVLSGTLISARAFLLVDESK